MTWTITAARGRTLTLEHADGWIDGAPVELTDADGELRGAPVAGTLSGLVVTLRTAIVGPDGRVLRAAPGDRLRAVGDNEPEPEAEPTPEPTFIEEPDEP